MKYLELLSDKIDFLFRKGKNADERCYDFFIRTITFLILALIILCYGSFVHADNSTLLSHFDINTSEVGNWLAWNDTNYNKFNNLRFDTLDIEYPIGSIGSNDISNLVYADGMDLNNNYIFIEDSQYSWFEIWFIPKNLIDNGNIVAKYDGNVVVYDSDNNYTVTRYSISYDKQTDPTQYSITNQTIPQGYGFYAGSLEPWTGYHTSFSNAPVYNLPNMESHESIRTWVSNGMQEDLSTYLMNNNYYNYFDDLLIQPWEDHVPVETTANNLALDKFEIAITGSKSPIGINQADLVIGVSTSNKFILNNIDKYDLKVTCSFGVTGNNIQSFVGSKQYIYPLSTFTNNVYEYSIMELARDIKVNNQSFMDYYFDILGTHDIKIANNPIKNYNGLIPTLINNVYEFLIGSYTIQSESNINFVKNAYLTIDLVLFDKDGNSSLHGTKIFNFKDGTSSITESGILQNQNPWDGEPTYTESPFTDSSGYTSSNGGVIQNNNQNVTINLDNRFQNIVSGGANTDDYDDTINNIKSLFGTFKESLAVMGDATLDSESNQPNGFVGLLTESYDYIPGMNWYVLGIVITVALCVLLFIIKALVF